MEPNLNPEVKGGLYIQVRLHLKKFFRCLILNIVNTVHKCFVLDLREFFVLFFRDRRKDRSDSLKRDIKIRCV